MLTEKEKINKQRNLFIIDTILQEKNSLGVVKKDFCINFEKDGEHGRTRTSDQWIMRNLVD